MQTGTAAASLKRVTRWGSVALLNVSLWGALHQHTPTVWSTVKKNHCAQLPHTASGVQTRQHFSHLRATRPLHEWHVSPGLSLAHLYSISESHGQHTGASKWPSSIGHGVCLKQRPFESYGLKCRARFFRWHLARTQVAPRLLLLDFFPHSLVKERQDVTHQRGFGLPCCLIKLKAWVRQTTSQTHCLPKSLCVFTKTQQHL